MTKNPIHKAIGVAIAMALGSLTTLSMAQSSMDAPSQPGLSYENQQPSYMQPQPQLLDGRTWGNEPRTQPRGSQQPRGAQGPAGSETSAWGRTKSYFAPPQAADNRGYAEFLRWREKNTDTP